MNSALISRKDLINEEVPDVKEIKNDARKISKNINITRTLFMDKYNVNSEYEYKVKMMNNDRLMRHAHIGWNSWEKTSEAFTEIYENLSKRDYLVDRFGVILDWTMGIPKHLRKDVPRATGLYLNNEKEWEQIGKIVPIHPHLGDHMIGSLNSIENVQLGLMAGATTIGNLSQFFAFDYPVEHKIEERATDTVKAIAVMAEFKDSGALVHSNLCDGFGGRYHDLSSVVGWAILERYIIEDLLGAKTAHCFGNVINSVESRMLLSLVLDDIHEGKSVGSMLYGNTIDYTLDFDLNYAVLSSYVMGDFMVQLFKPTGHAINPVPITEAMRIPTPDEIIQAQVISNMAENKAREMFGLVNWDKLIEKKDLLFENGQKFYKNTLEGLELLGIDIKNPVELLVSLRNMGPIEIERRFGVGKIEGDSVSRTPIIPTDVRKQIEEKKSTYMEKTQSKKDSLKGIKVVLGSTDVHEYGSELVESILVQAGARVYDLGVGVDEEEFAQMAIETGSDFVAISTYIGIALSYGKKITKKFEDYNLDIPIIMGGVLNENQPGGSLAVDVTDDLINLGIHATNSAEEIIEIIQNNQNDN